MIFQNCAKTDTGILRTENQDSFGVCQDENFFFVCDGMGGGVAGDFASKYAVNVILSSFLKLSNEECFSIVGEEFALFNENIIRPVASIKLANKALNNLTIRYPKLAGMGTTFTGVWFERETALLHIYNVGDSRVYRVRNGSIKLLTEDHSKIKELIDNGKMTEEEAKTAEIQSMITRALGIMPTVKVDYKAEIVKPGDIYVLCTDGLNGEISDFTINDIISLHKPNIESISDELILAANNAGGRDNTTVVTLYAQDEQNFNAQIPLVVQQNIITFDDEKHNESLKEDFVIHRLEKNFEVQIPELAKQRNFFTNPIVIAVMLVLLCVIGIFLHSTFSQKEQKSIIELTGNISGLKLDVRTLSREKIEEIQKTEDQVFKMQILQDCIKNKDILTIPMSNVTIMLESNGQNKFMGLSSYVPLDIKLPKGRYLMTLTYPSYKILDENLQLRDSINIYLENSGSLQDFVVVMVPD
ncbi:MAG: protein phosphatase 2C domain-containing protein [Paludibacter sp.]|nr:protein phosphatase 2C domain-containing protein [Paludibacter sp.]